MLKAGREMGFDEVELTADQCAPARKLLDMPMEREGSGLTVREDDHYLTVVSEKFCYTYDKLKGLFSRMVNANQNLLEHPMEYNVWRAPTDNDRNIRSIWEECHYERPAARAYGTSCENGEKDGRQYVEIASDVSLSSVYKQRIVDIRAAWRVWADGSVDVRLDVKKDSKLPRLPRFGVRMMLPQDMRQVEYYGLGPMESYADKRRASYHGRFTETVDSLFEDYIRPQENGSHCDVSFVELFRENVKLSVAAEKPFSFNASRYTQEELTEKAHNFELVPSGHTVLCIDYTQDGIGSNSCGPGPEKQYQFLEEEFTFAFGIRVEGQA